MRPIQALPDGDSLRNIGERTATKSGAVCTSTTELATEVSSRLAIQEAKWMARKDPERIPSVITRLVDGQALRGSRSMNGSKRIVANPILKAAIARLLASTCAKRIKSEEVEAAKMPKMIAIDGGILGLVCMYLRVPLHILDPSVAYFLDKPVVRRIEFEQRPDGMNAHPSGTIRAGQFEKLR
jgi:hypothetical protein